MKFPYLTNTTNIHNLAYYIEKNMVDGQLNPIFIYENKIIEFNGDCFHTTPFIYNEHDYSNPFHKTLTASYIWEKEAI